MFLDLGGQMQSSLEQHCILELPTQMIVPSNTLCRMGPQPCTAFKAFEMCLREA